VINDQNMGREVEIRCPCRLLAAGDLHTLEPSSESTPELRGVVLLKVAGVR
jgi:hypothetical protein